MHQNKNFFIVLFLLVFSTGMFILTPESSAAGLQYELLEKIPGTAGLGSDLKGYIEAIYKVALIVITLAAVLMLSVGGFMYLTSAGNTSAMGSAKGIIFDALIGLVIALTASLLLFVINPDLVKVSLNGLSPVPITQPIGAGVPAPAPPVIPKAGAPWPVDTLIRNDLRMIDMNRANCDTEGQSAKCTSLSGLGITAINGLKALKKDCLAAKLCTAVMVTGGTEYWFHGDKTTTITNKTKHRPGNSVVDIRRGDIAAYLIKTARIACTLEDKPVYRLNGADYWDENKGEVGDHLHFHVSFGTPICP